MLVPYNPDARCRRPDSARSNFADFLRRGGRIEPINIGAQSDERIPLVAAGKDNQEAIEMMRLQVRQARITQFAVIVALALAMSVFIGLGVVVWRVNENLGVMEAHLAPHADTIVNSTVSMLNEIGGASMDFHSITGMTKQLAETNMGPSGPAGRAINSTALITERVAAFLRHPTLKLSMGAD